jgi:hypothetical protein
MVWEYVVYFKHGGMRYGSPVNPFWGVALIRLFATVGIPPGVAEVVFFMAKHVFVIHLLFVLVPVRLHHNRLFQIGDVRAGRRSFFAAFHSLIQVFVFAEIIDSFREAAFALGFGVLGFMRSFWRKRRERRPVRGARGGAWLGTTSTRVWSRFAPRTTTPVSG